MSNVTAWELDPDAPTAPLEDSKLANEWRKRFARRQVEDWTWENPQGWEDGHTFYIQDTKEWIVLLQRRETFDYTGYKFFFCV